MIVLSAINEPKRYAPLSPKKIFALGKLNNKIDNKIIVWEINIKENSVFALFRLMYTKTKLIIMRLITSKPLKPSIKFAPLTMNKKQRRTNKTENISLFVKEVKKGISIFVILIGKKIIMQLKKKIINNSLLKGLILNLRSSRNPTKNIE